MFDIAQRSKPFIIAEIGLNHNGSLNTAKRLIDGAVGSGADAVKLQVYKTDEFIPKDSGPFLHIKDETREKSTLFDFFQSCELSREDIIKLRKYASDFKIKFGCSVFSESLYDFCYDLKPDFIKVASSELDYCPLLKYLQNIDIPIIASTGMSNLNDIEKSVRRLCGKDLALLYCCSLYPPDAEDIFLNNIDILHNKFNIPVGFSDHFTQNHFSLLALFYGSPVFERHFTLDRNMEGPDHQLSLDVSELKEYIYLLNTLYLSLQKKEYCISEKELNAKKFIVKRAYAKKGLQKGNCINLEDIIFLRNSEGISYNDFIDCYSNRPLIKDIKQGEQLLRGHFYGQ